MSYYLTTDTHFGHERMLELCNRPRGYEELILSNLSKLSESDILIHLGDFCWGKDAYWTEIFMSRVKCIKWLIRGNHDSKPDGWYFRKGWSWVNHERRILWGDKRILFTHRPAEDHWCDLNIHGHLHNNDHRKNEMPLNGYNLLLAIENNNYEVWSLDKLIKDYFGPSHLEGVIIRS